MRKSYGRIFFGGFLIILGVLIIFDIAGYLNLSFLASLSPYWPVGIILIGAALMLKQRAIAAVFLLLTILFLLFSHTSNFDFVWEEHGRNITFEVENEKSVDRVELELNYGAGEIGIGSGRADILVKNEVHTNDLKDPSMTKIIYDDTARITFDRSPTPRVWAAGDDNWEIEISPDKVFDITLNYGASDVLLDLRNLSVDEIKASSGASSTEIVFNRYPTEVEIETGASSISLSLPRGYGARIDIEGGVLTTDLEGFTKRDGEYYNEWYDAEKDNIDIKIEAGATTIDTMTYD